jgi:hypothetical protein
VQGTFRLSEAAEKRLAETLGASLLHRIDAASAGPDVPVRGPSRHARRRRSAFEMTDTELRLIAALAIIGLSNKCNQG